MTQEFNKFSAQNILTKMAKPKVPIHKLSKSERLWLQELYSNLEKNEKLDFKEIWSKLNGKIKNNFRPLAMNLRLISAHGEEIRLLGIVALKKNYKILDQCNKVIRTIEGIIDLNPLIENIETQVISEKSGVSFIETSIILGVINEYGRFWRDAKYDVNKPSILSIRVTGEDQIFYQYKSFTRIQDLILATLDRAEADQKWLNSPIAETKSQPIGNTYFVSPKRIEELQKIQNPKFDFCKLIKMCQEINDNYSRGNFLATAMIGRTILNHVPPLFDYKRFEEVANNYGGANDHKSFKKNMQHLNNSLKNIADNHLHSQIREKEVLPNETQVDFRQDLDVLLAEIIRISAKLYSEEKTST